MATDIEKRLIDLEIRYTHQEDLLVQLNKIVVTQSQAIDKMSEELKEIKLSSVGSQESIGSEKPPHY